MVAVAHHKVGQVALVPLVKEARVVVLSFLSAPHIERFVHYDEAHRVAHIKQFGSRWVVRASYCVHAHVLELREFSVHRVLVERRAEASQVVMLAHSVYLHILSVEEKAFLRIEVEVAEPRGGIVSVHDFAADEHLGLHIIYIRIVELPQFAVWNG